jgi:hypothetical protein
MGDKMCTVHNVVCENHKTSGGYHYHGCKLCYEKITGLRDQSKYAKLIKSIDGKELGLIDVYSVLNAFEVNNPAIAHAVKKLLMPGKRGAKTVRQDVQEATDSLVRSLKDYD